MIISCCAGWVPHFRQTARLPQVPGRMRRQRHSTTNHLVGTNGFMTRHARNGSLAGSVLRRTAPSGTSRAAQLGRIWGLARSEGGSPSLEMDRFPRFLDSKGFDKRRSPIFAFCREACEVGCAGASAHHHRLGASGKIWMC